MSYSVLVHKDRVKEYLKSLDDGQKQHNENLSQLSQSPYPGKGLGDKKQIEGIDKPNNLFRVRSGDHRGIYYVLEQDQEVRVLDFDRKERFERKYGID